ncbi:MAG: Anaerobic glycerol-3-phosphate dehydrogenase subunit C [Syntrophorhabdaceae bacterium PtaU1.Bin034]|nr:MAG: Anaerobic glycerol-3-phosphate dehydrogenase subunit C [Syntrophorhabdaceae bacterium PtaU1.Bin034]
MATDRFDTPKTPVALDVTDLNNFKYDMSRCIKCKGCYWVEHTYMPGVRFSTRCPSNVWNDFDSYGAFGKMRIGTAMLEKGMEWTPKLLEIIYADPLCGACDVGCKRNLDLEIGLTLEAMRVKAVKEGAGPMPAHKKVAANIASKHNQFGATAANRKKWVTKNVKLAEKADVVYFAGCSASYKNPEIAQSTAKILNGSGTPFMLMPEEWCCGNVLYSVGMIDEARELAKRNIEMMKATGAKKLLTSCAECYRTWKVDYPKMLNIATADLGFEVIHLLEYADEAVNSGALKLTKPIDARMTYHDSCGVSRLCDPWTPWSGTRGWMGMVEPRLKRRRGRSGLYAQPRNILNAIPGAQYTEMVRIRENSFCCSAGRGTKEAFPDLANSSAKLRLEEVREIGAEVLVSSCPWCKDNFGQAVKENGDNVKVMDIAEVIAAAM